ncbi:NAD(P)-dependent oxidoreductase [Actinoplanes palleronii]|uniref:NAD(P)-binding domain-containing protein n=1 Tax=Actinoplanes palleronii TaxID=113570 RepID=A0ABQ4BMB3_9ACTN|nr:NAD(P)H-binding protein [Actinoplanes palleronii]GIE71809.1 hypothetical protein Apa02nite_079170 [Actinoplanes palleronii]
MRVAVLGATGAVGKLLVSTALARGLEVTALARDPAQVPDRPGLRRLAVDVHDPTSIAEAIQDCDVLISGLGVSAAHPTTPPPATAGGPAAPGAAVLGGPAASGAAVLGGPAASGAAVLGGPAAPGAAASGSPAVAMGTLEAGAVAAVASGVPRIIWLGAYGTGLSAERAGGVTRAILRLVLGAEVPDKVAADSTILAAGGTVFHAGPLASGPPEHRTVALDAVPRRVFPSRISRAAVAAAMLDEAVTPRFLAQTVVVLAS